MDLGGRGLGQKGQQFKFDELFVGGRKVLRRSPEAGCYREYTRGEYLRTREWKKRAEDRDEEQRWPGVERES